MENDLLIVYKDEKYYLCSGEFLNYKILQEINKDNWKDIYKRINSFNIILKDKISKNNTIGCITNRSEEETIRLINDSIVNQHELFSKINRNIYPIEIDKYYIKSQDELFKYLSTGQI